jgi:hypothetical protein
LAQRFCVCVFAAPLGYCQQLIQLIKLALDVAVRLLAQVAEQMPRLLE